MERIRPSGEDAPGTGGPRCPSGADSNAGQHQYTGTSLRFRSTEKKGPQAIGRSKGGLTTKIHMIAGCPDHGMEFSLSPGNASDFSEGKKLIEKYVFPESVTHLLLDKGYSFYETLLLCCRKGIEAVVPPKSNFKKKWRYNKNLYTYRNEIERHFHRLKNYRRIATRYDKLDTSYAGFIQLGMVALLVNILC